MTRYIQGFLLILLAFVSQYSQAQIYPVQVVPTVVSPYSSKLSDYSNPMVNRLNLQLITTDILMQNQPVELHIKIQGNGITAQTAPILLGIRPIYLNGGEILSLSSIELADYFRFQNLHGITTSQYSKPLPDGVYNICYQVLDAVTKKKLSQNSCATIYLMLNDPPILNLPSQNEQIASIDFTNIIFSWTPRQINATNVSYQYELKEILDPNLDPRFAFEVSPLLYKEEGLRSTTLLYNISKPTLIPGKRYAWRVKAISTSGLGENSVFKNDGYSEVYTFSYTVNCSAPRFLLSEQQSHSRVKVMWQGESSIVKYHLQYRKSNVENAEWFEIYTYNTQIVLSDLEHGFTYDFRVGASCENTVYGVQQSYVYSNIQTFSISEKDKDAESKYNCGIVPKIEIENREPLPSMVINETFMAGDFPVKVLDVSGDNGWYSGRGYIQVPYLFDTRIEVVFNNININNNYQLIDGVVETTYDPDWSNVEDAYVLIDDLLNDFKDLFNKIEKIEKGNGQYANQLEKGEISKEEYDNKIKINDSLLNDYYLNIDENINSLATSDFIGEDEIEELRNKNNSTKLVYNDIAPGDVPNIINENEINRSGFLLIIEEVKSREKKFLEGLLAIQQAIEQTGYAYINCKVCKETTSNTKTTSKPTTSLDSSKTFRTIDIKTEGGKFPSDKIRCLILAFNQYGFLQEIKPINNTFNIDVWALFRFV